MRILAIIAHDKKKSLTHTIFKHVVDYLQTQECTVEVLDLYDHCHEIPFYTHDKNILENSPFFIKNKKLFLQADRLILVFPMYWFNIPGILKCWLDLITNFAWEYTGGYKAAPLHSIKKVCIIYTTIYPWWYCMLMLRNCISLFLVRTFAWMGVKKTHSYAITSIYQLTDKKITNHLLKISTLLKRLISTS